MRITNLLNPIDTRVARGAALLDRKNPRWFLRLDAPMLDMRDGTQCVLGRLYGQFGRGRMKLNLTRRDVVRLGFYVPLFTPHSLTNYYALLTQAWVREIEFRKRQHYEARIVRAVKQIEDRAARMNERNNSLYRIEKFANNIKIEEPV